MYLTREANLTTLRAIAECCKQGSSVVFTYTDELGLLPGSQSAAYERMKRNVAVLGEPFLSGFDPQQLSAILAGVGFVLEEDLSGLDLSERYACPAVPPLLPSAFSRIALAVVNPTTVSS
jgi:O-methyltransferase involved in polyketide biosynthesis